MYVMHDLNGQLLKFANINDQFPLLLAVWKMIEIHIKTALPSSLVQVLQIAAVYCFCKLALLISRSFIISLAWPYLKRNNNWIIVKFCWWFVELSYADTLNI